MGIIDRLRHLPRGATGQMRPPVCNGGPAEGKKREQRLAIYKRPRPGQLVGNQFDGGPTFSGKNRSENIICLHNAPESDFENVIADEARCGSGSSQVKPSESASVAEHKSVVRPE